MHNLAFGVALRQHRLSLGLTQQELAERAGLDRTYISLLELGRNSPTLETLYFLCEALNVPLPHFAQQIDNALTKY